LYEERYTNNDGVQTFKNKPVKYLLTPMVILQKTVSLQGKYHNDKENNHIPLSYIDTVLSVGYISVDRQ
jgi:hypothetical protein